MIYIFVDKIYISRYTGACKQGFLGALEVLNLSAQGLHSTSTLGPASRGGLIPGKVGWMVDQKSKITHF